MKKWIVIGIVSFWMCGTAEAAISDLPVVGQVWKIGACLITDAAKLGKIVVTHTTQATTEILGVVSDCIKFTLDTATSVVSIGETHVEIPQ